MGKNKLQKMEKWLKDNLPRTPGVDTRGRQMTAKLSETQTKIEKLKEEVDKLGGWKKFLRHKNVIKHCPWNVLFLKGSAILQRNDKVVVNYPTCTKFGKSA